MRSLLSARATSVRIAAVVAMMLILASTTSVAGKRPPKPSPTAPPPASATIAIEIAPTGTLEPSRQYLNVDVTVTCPVGWTWVRGSTNVRQGTPGGSGSFTASCTGTPQVAHSRVVNGNKWTLGDATALAFVTISKNGQEAQGSSTRTISLQPGVTARIADQGQLNGTGVKIAVAVACPSGATGVSSSISVSQDDTAQGAGTFTPICDGTSRTFVVAMPTSTGPFHVGGATSEAFATVTWNGQGFYGIDSRAITLLESSTGDTTPPSQPALTSVSIFSDGETWLNWAASTDNATPSGLISYEVRLNGRFDQGIGGGYTQAILYADLGVMNTIEVFAIDGAGNRSTPAIVMVDCTAGFGCLNT